jgi:PAS domain-containing protein
VRNVRGPALPAAKNSSDPPLPAAARSTFETVQAPPVKTEFDAVFESSGEALMVVDAQGTLHAANRRARELLRLKKESLAHLRASDFLSTPAVDNFISWCERTASASSAARLDALLPTGHTIRVTLRTILPDSHHMLVCLEEGSVVARAEEKWRHTASGSQRE